MRRIRSKITRITALFAAPNLLFLLLMLAPSSTVIGILNAAVLALAIGVCVAFFPAAWDALFFREELDRADYLALGIFCGWLGLIVQRVFAIAWRGFGRPDSWENAHAISYSLYLLLFAGAYHLAAPGAIDGRVPPQRWVMIGVIVALAAFLFIVSGYTDQWLYFT